MGLIKRISIAEAKEIDMVSFLAGLGYQPVKIRSNDLWYLSPLRNEKNASFKINKKLNRWYDHGLGAGGNLVDFGIKYYGCTVAEFLDNLSGNFSLQQPFIKDLDFAKSTDGKIIVQDILALTSYRLIEYLKKRSISFDVAREFCEEVRYKMYGKTYYAIGFLNDLGGYEIRNEFHKLSSSPKGITTIQNNAEVVSVFEGFFDFLSFKSSINFTNEICDIIVLNSISFLEKIMPVLDHYQEVHLYLDRDNAGLSATKVATSRSNIYYDKSSLYDGFNDFNSWFVNSRETQNPTCQAHKKPPDVPASLNLRDFFACFSSVFSPAGLKEVCQFLQTAR